MTSPTRPPSIDVSSPAPKAAATPTSPRASRSRKSSVASLASPRLATSSSMNGSLSMSPSGGVEENGLGSLADELAEGWDEEGEEGEEEGEQNEQIPTPSPSSPVQKARHHTRNASKYDGSEYGSETELGPSGMSSGLEKRIAAIEALARQKPVVDDDSDSEHNVIPRVISSLRDLGGQAGVESSATRLITAHTALTSHLAHQARSLHQTTFPLLSPLTLPPPPDLIDALIPLISDLAAAIPQPSTPALAALADLHALSADLVSVLSYTSDTLHMSRQNTTSAARKLRAVTDLVAEFRAETELVDGAARAIERGGWNERLASRECGRVCGEVVGGFEEVLETWRRRLFVEVA